MSYSNGKTAMESFVTNVKKMNIGSIWKGAAATSYVGQIDSIITRINKEKDNIQTFENILDKVEIMKSYDRKIKALESSLSGLDPEEDGSKIARIKSSIRWYKNEKKKLKDSVIGLLGSISPDAGSESSLLFNNTANFDYICDIKELEARIKKCYVYFGVDANGKNYGNIANLYNDAENGISGVDYVNGKLNSVLKSYKGREAAVNSVLMSMMLAADKGYKYRYTNSGANGYGGIKYNTNEQMMDGMDCCAYVSWAINKGTPQPFHWEGVGGLKIMGDTVDISQALPGDILAKSNSDGSGAHVMMVVANNPETGQITIAESGGDSSNVHLSTHNYADYTRQGYKAQSLEDYYTGVKSNVNGTGSIKFDTWKEKVEYY